MTSRICVDLKIVGRLRTYGRLEQLRACGHDFGVSFLEVVDPQIEVDLLRSPVRPLGWYVVWRELDPHFRLAVHKHHVPVVLGIHRATQQSSPEVAFCVQVSGVEDDDLEVDLHSAILITRSRRAPSRIDGSAAMC
jgi:hypothetical protein